ncbi:2-oxo acid dehydrogenase subunit E2 [Marinospirillum insulare]|uniref:Dihydrolipoamide acetyltransferase component of pyruvate dehydrogenase complex n=1 Tax=Marinospirillum insulare TaxID=217169 RepID=A0ABQ5ZZZ7_9GAMM|nr:2-oxo acid dehydrogenase subunit E2 [Marinospirillum insulare]GLR64246.1 dihydrolipoamide acetyltransferase component of pyruvate dehydrogenase complex [Marinospirillum insulare]
MKIDFILPDIGEGIVECELVEWHLAEGATVEEDQPVADVMTDKALVEITAMHTGVITKHYWKKGEIAKVGEPLFEIQVAGEAAANTETAEVESKTVEIETKVAEVETKAADQVSVSPNAKALASPAVRRIARELDLDLNQVVGSGKEGRVLKEDLLPLQQAGTQQSEIQQSEAQQNKTQQDQNLAKPEVNRVEPIKGIQAAMAKQMQEAYSTIPHFTYAESIDVTELEALRQELKLEFEQAGQRLSLMPFFMKALALAVKQFPILNSQVNADCTQLTYLSDINIGMAVASSKGLLVPNIKQVQNKTLRELAGEITQVTELAREVRLPPASMKGGSITISNIGVIGGTVATPIINKPEVAIVALGRMQKLPRFNAAGEVEARQIMDISWSADHRVVDGATLASFCNLWKSYLEKPARMLTELS